MANTLFNLVVAPPSQKRSIIDGSSYLIDLLLQLSKVDEIFDEFTFSTEKIKEVINIKKSGRDEAITALSELFFKINKSYIKKVTSGNHIPTLDYSWDLGFRFLLKFYANGKQRFAMTGNISTPSYPDISIQYFYSKHTYSLDWFINILKCLIDNTNSDYGILGIFGHPLLSKELEAIKLMYHIGWITFFSKENPVQMPMDLEGIEYELTDRGMFLKLPNKGFTDDETGLYPNQVNTIISVMREIKKRTTLFSTMTF